MGKKEDEKKRVAILRFAGASRLYQLGGSRAIIIPAIWGAVHAWNIDGVDWVTARIEGDAIIIEPIDKERVSGLMRDNNVGL